MKPSLPGYFLTQDEEARRLLAIAVSRQASRFVAESTVARIKLTEAQIKDGIKGKIVGKDGRNSRYFEEQAGVDLVLNEFADSVLISCFDSFRREVARVALEQLIQDGRIQVAKIDESLIQARNLVDRQVREAGSTAAAQLGIQGLHPAIIRVLGTLKLRQSFGQNQLGHSIETAWLAGNLAAELGFDVPLARRAGLLHDLGKALDQTHDSGHALAGGEFAKKYGETAEVVQAISAHHEELGPVSWLDHLVIAADALSGARPGARHGSTQTALDRATAFEKIALSFPGVSSSFAVQAGRELRVFVDGEKIPDEAVRPLARQIADEIVKQVQFPGEIKVTVLREIRVVEVASR
ncbi:MAG: HDIG domain-containing protein [Bdellovibrio sp.]|nr:HDIG domain-containing protein [Bdellovibrio sp.]